MGAVADPGAGFDVFLGVEVGRWAAIEFDWASGFRSGPNQRSALHSVTIEGKVFALPAGSVVRPYLSLGAGASVVHPDLDFARVLAGPALTAAVGADLVLGNHLLLGARLGWRGMYVDDAAALGPFEHRTAFLNDMSGSVRVGFRF